MRGDGGGIVSLMSRLDVEARLAQQVLLLTLDRLRTLGQEIPTAREDLDDVMVSVDVAIDCLSAILGEER